MAEPSTEEFRRRRLRGEIPEDAVAPMVSAMAGFTALGAAAASGVAGGWSQDSKYGQNLDNQFRLAGFRERLPGLAEDFYYDREAGASQKPGFDLASGNGFWPGKVKGGNGFTNALVYDLKEKRVLLREIDWDRSAKIVGNKWSNPLSRPLNWATNVPEYGEDLGGFQRRYGIEPGSDSIKAYTVTPGVNSGRFASRRLPNTIDEVYGGFKPDNDGTPKERRFTSPSRGRVPSSAILADDPGTGPIWAENELGAKVRAMDAMAPGQSMGQNQSAVLWGTTLDEPRYSYADAAGKPSSNPEIHVSFVKTPADLQTDYAYTGNTHSPYVNRYSQPAGEYTPGPHWGVAEGAHTSNLPGNRQRRDIRGDVSWRADLTEARGTLSLADLNAIQGKLGIPVTGLIEGKDNPSQVLDQAVKSVRDHLGLQTDAEVVDRFAKRAPRLGRTTTPRQPAKIQEGSFTPDATPGIPSALKRAYDLPGALERVGLPPVGGSLAQLNTEIARGAEQRAGRISRLAGGAPFIGAMTGLLDPEAVGTLARASRASDPAQGRQLLLQGMETLGRNTVIGSATGGAVQLGMKALAARAPVMAARVLPVLGRGLAVGGPVGLATTAYATADAMAEGLTGRTLTDRGVTAVRENVSPAIVGPTSAQAVSQLFPQPRSVSANTPSGVASLTQTRSTRVGDRGAGGRVFAGEGWGWQSSASYDRLRREGRLPGQLPSPGQMARGVTNSAPVRAVRQVAQDRMTAAARARSRGPKIPGLPEFGLSEFLFGGRR